MGIFGTGSPRFKVGSTTVDLDYSVIEKNEPDFKTTIHEADLNSRARAFVTRKYHWDFFVMEHLYKYADPQDKLEKILTHLNAEITQLFVHRDGNPFQDASANDVKFVLYEFNRFYLTRTDYKDGLRLMFKSVDPVDYLVTSQQILVTEQGELDILTEDGQQIQVG